MTDRLTCHEMEVLCRQRAVLESSNGEQWLARAEGWRGIAYQQTAAQFHGSDLLPTMGMYPPRKAGEEDSKSRLDKHGEPKKAQKPEPKPGHYPPQDVQHEEDGNSKKSK
jgi:hypothetical protein